MAKHEKGSLPMKYSVYTKVNFKQLSPKLGGQYMNKAAPFPSIDIVKKRPRVYKNNASTESCFLCICRGNGSRMRSHLYHSAGLVGIISCWALSVFDVSSRIWIESEEADKNVVQLHP